MPIYEYECNKCNITREIVVRIQDEPPKHIKCEKCKSLMKKIISLCSFSLKGKGWYKDGYSK